MKAEFARHVVLIIDDDRLLCEMTREFLASDTLEVLIAHSGQEGLQTCASHHVDVVLLDQKLPDGEGSSLCRQIIAHSETAKIIFITAFPSFKNALQAIENGAFSYLTKPFDLKELKLSIDKCLRVNELEKAEESIHYQNDRSQGGAALIGKTGSLAPIMELVRAAAETPAPVLITGETGSGKSLVARLIHQQSRRRGPFMAINCAALPENLIESELFGHEKGAFSGAHALKKGLLEIAENGTILLDEIGEMSSHLQAKLLGVLDEMQIRRIGGVVFHPIHVRILAATNIALEERIKRKEFRQDLFYRLNVIRIHLPPLRERGQDIPHLARAFLAEIAPHRKLTLAAAELQKLAAYSWPGNVRELRNVIERAILQSTSEGTLQLAALIPELPGADGTTAAAKTEGNILPLAEIELQHIEATLARLDRNLTRTAKALGISLNTLKKKLTAGNSR
ncbi:MAG: sigma-54 dependent transcriptional regulator [Candidatus Aminicenantes bacterium]|nr:sigma-54 dependent transcriptional regulator [Candidatus Aminicenantes bacterium]